MPLLFVLLVRLKGYSFAQTKLKVTGYLAACKITVSQEV
jgi:hypothetical protein